MEGSGYGCQTSTVLHSCLVSITPANVHVPIYLSFYWFCYLQTTILKSRTVLNGLLPEMWTPEHDAQITDFITDCSEQLLLLYIDEQNGLTACSQLPPHLVEEVAYFAREENAEVTKKNFSAVVQFGTIQGSYVDTLLRSMHDLYAPTFFENASWPDSILFQRKPFTDSGVVMPGLCVRA